MATPAAPEPPQSVTSQLSAWGNSSVPPAGLATLITALHWRPLQLFPMTFVPLLLFSSYANLQTFKIDSAGLTASASGTYALLAFRRKTPGGFRGRFTLRAGVRAAAIGLGIANCLAGAWVYATGDREAEKRTRKENPRWVEK